jgi:hypothetical protein
MQGPEGENMAKSKQVRTRGSLSVLLGVILATAMLCMAGAASAALDTSPWIQSDKADYAPGSTVTLDGGNWVAGDTVHIFVDDSSNHTWQHSADVTADAGGSIHYVFTLPTTFVSDYSVTATDAANGDGATTSFTDADLFIQNTDGSAPSTTATQGNQRTYKSVILGGGNGCATPVTWSATNATVTPTSAAVGGTVTVTYNTVGTATVSVTSPHSTGSGNCLGTLTVSVGAPPDTTPPSISITSPANNSSTTSSSITVSGTASDAGGIQNVKVNGVLATGTTSWSRSAVPLACGSNTISAVATDNAGNPGSASISVTRNCDTTPPVITKVVSGTSGDNGWYTSNVTVTWSVNDPDSAVVIDSGCGIQNFTASTASVTSACSAHSAGGSASDSVTLKIDKEAPTVGISAARATDHNGWYNAAITFSASSSNEGPSGAGSCDDPKNYSGPDSGSAGVSFTCSDGAGNSTTAGFTFKYDATAPSIQGSRSPAANANGWNNSNVTVSYLCTDDTSGVASCSADDVLSSEGANQSSSGTAMDNAGNFANDTVNGINIDMTAPSITASRSPVANANGWNNSNVTVSYSCNDGLSGIAACPADDVLSANGMNQSASGTATDKAGNTASDGVAGINIDKTAPTITASRSPAANANGWNNSAVTVHYTCSDVLSGIASCPSDDVLSGQGAGQSASGTATDLAGNSDAASVNNINIDTTNPTATGNASPGPNGNGWNKTDVTVNFTGNDGLSGIDFCDDSVTFTSEGTHSASGKCTDKAGNESAASAAVTVKIDKTNPNVSLSGGPAAGGTYFFGSVPAAPTCNASDALSGIDGSCSVSGYSTALGSHTVTASANDKAGNSNSDERTYTVNPWTLRGFYAPVDMGSSVVNTVKAGSTVPLKFEIFAGSNELTDTANVQSLGAKLVACGTFSGDSIDEIELTATGGTALRYDTTAGQYIYNWKTPTGAAKCYIVTMTTDDGSKLSAQFKTK